MPAPGRDPAVEYTDVDLNADATTALYSGSRAGTVWGVHMENGGATAVVRLEVTDGTDTAVLTPGQTAGDGIDYGGPIEVATGETLQANVTTVEGAAQSNTAAVIRSEE